MLTTLPICTLLIFLSIPSGLGERTTKYPLSNEAKERFREALKLKTVCTNEEEFKKLHQHIKTSFPTLHNSNKVTLRTISKHSLLYKVKGTGSGLPYLLLAHLDVVPADGSEWKYPPFEASIHDGFIHARGAVDDKHNAFAILETVEELLKTGTEIKKSFYIFFGHDEECLGLKGAHEAAKLLKNEGVKFEWVLDEGPFIIQGMIPGVTAPIANIGVAEKGYLTVKLEVKMKGGHASVPPVDYSIPVLARAVGRLASGEQTNMFGKGIEMDTFKELSKYATAPYNNVYKTPSVLIQALKTTDLGKSPVFKALTQTTTAITIFRAGDTENTIPTVATAFVNHRVHNLQTIEEVVEWDKKVIDDNRVNVTVKYASAPVSGSCYPTEATPSCKNYDILKRTIEMVWKDDDIKVAPGLLMGMTDSRHFKELADDIYRFTPIHAQLGTTGMHAANEKISLEQYATMLHFYKCLITEADK